MSSNGWKSEGVPDTFDFSISFNGTVPVTVYFLTFNQYVQFVNSLGSISGVSGYYSYYSTRTSLQNGVFRLAEGCGGYIAVFQSIGSGIIYPNVVATYNPASSLTGVCASNP
ncbi:MAG: hypothetical protein ACLPY5_05495 [Candidatus Bathyarchaeia archaeon]